MADIPQNVIVFVFLPVECYMERPSNQIHEVYLTLNGRTVMIIIDCVGKSSNACTSAI